MSGDNQILRPRYVNLEGITPTLSTLSLSLIFFSYLSILVFQKKKRENKKRHYPTPNNFERSHIPPVEKNCTDRCLLSNQFWGPTLENEISWIYARDIWVAQVESIHEEKSISSPPVPLAVSTAYNQPSSRLTKRLCRLRPGAPRFTGHTRTAVAQHTWWHRAICILESCNLPV